MNTPRWTGWFLIASVYTHTYIQISKYIAGIHIHVDMKSNVYVYTYWRKRLGEEFRGGLAVCASRQIRGSRYPVDRRSN